MRTAPKERWLQSSVAVCQHDQFHSEQANGIEINNIAVSVPNPKFWYCPFYRAGLC